MNESKLATVQVPDRVPPVNKNLHSTGAKPVTINGRPTIDEVQTVLHPECVRVEMVLKNNRDLACYTSPKTESLQDHVGSFRTYSLAVVEIVQALHKEGKSGAKVPQAEIWEIARKVIQAGRLSRGTCEPVAALPDPALPAKGGVPPVTVDAKDGAIAPGTLVGHKIRRDLTNKGDQTFPRQTGQASAQRVRLEVVTTNAAIVLPDTLEEFTTLIKRRVQSYCERVVSDVIRIGEAFLAAAQKYGQGLKELAAMSALSYNMISQYAKLAKRFGAANRSWARAQLPASVDSLVRLSRLEPAQLEDAIKTGKVSPTMGRAGVKALLREYRPGVTAPLKPDGSRKAASPAVPAELEEVENQFETFQRVVVELEQRLPESRKELVGLLETCAGRIKETIGNLRRKRGETNVKKAQAIAEV